MILPRTEGDGGLSVKQAKTQPKLQLWIKKKMCQYIFLILGV